jgi:hypothetical protein
MSRQGLLEPAAGPAIEGYLAEVTARLPGPPRARAGIVAELRSGLLDAADAHRSAGVPPAEAALAAVREFGDPAEVAAGFGAELAASQARRVAVTLLATGPLVGLLWIATALASHLGIRLALPWQETGLSPGLRIGMPLVAVAVGSPPGPRCSASPPPAGSPGGCPPGHAGPRPPRRSPGSARWAPTGSAWCCWWPSWPPPRGGSPRSQPPWRRLPASPGCCSPGAPRAVA